MPSTPTASQRWTIRQESAREGATSARCRFLFPRSAAVFVFFTALAGRAIAFQGALTRAGHHRNNGVQVFQYAIVARTCRPSPRTSGVRRQAKRGELVPSPNSSTGTRQTISVQRTSTRQAASVHRLLLTHVPIVWCSASMVGPDESGRRGARTRYGFGRAPAGARRARGSTFWRTYERTIPTFSGLPRGPCIDWMPERPSSPDRRVDHNPPMSSFRTSYT